MKEDLKAKEELWKLKNYFTMKKFIFKKSSKRNQNPLLYNESQHNNILAYQGQQMCF
jgi:N12 class adenine-specific DNA methylase